MIRVITTTGDKQKKYLFQRSNQRSIIEIIEDGFASQSQYSWKSYAIPIIYLYKVQFFCYVFKELPLVVDLLPKTLGYLS